MIQTALKYYETLGLKPGASETKSSACVQGDGRYEKIFNHEAREQRYVTYRHAVPSLRQYPTALILETGGGAPQADAFASFVNASERELKLKNCKPRTPSSLDCD